MNLAGLTKFSWKDLKRLYAAGAGGLSPQAALADDGQAVVLWGREKLGWALRTE